MQRSSLIRNIVTNILGRPCSFAHSHTTINILTLLKYLTSSWEASSAESSFSFLMTSQSWAGSVLCDWHEEESAMNSLFCLSWIERFLNSRAASRASMASSSWSRECSSYRSSHTKHTNKNKTKNIKKRSEHFISNLVNTFTHTILFLSWPQQWALYYPSAGHPVCLSSF